MVRFARNTSRYRRARTGKRRAVRRGVRTNAIGRTRSIASMTHTFKRDGRVIQILNSQTDGSWGVFNLGTNFAVGTNSPDFGGGFQFPVSASFSLKDVIDYTDFTDLFDRYKITKVVLKIMYQTNIGVGSNGILPVMNYTFDCDDADLPVNQQDVTRKGYVKTKILNANRPFSWVCKPRISKQVYDGLNAAYMSERPCWLDCTNPDVPHFAFKAWLRNCPIGTVENNSQFAQITIQPVYYLALKDTQ